MNNPKNQISSKIKFLVCALLAILALFACPSALAANATDTWVGNTSANLNDVNWTGNPLSRVMTGSLAPLVPS